MFEVRSTFLVQTDNKGIFLIIRGQTELISFEVNSEKSDRLLAYQMSRLILYTKDFFSTSRIKGLNKEKFLGTS